MKLICKLFRLDPDTREGVISATSALGIIVNLLIALVKVIAGVLASSIAIISEGINNASDALTSVLTFIGTKLAGRHPDEKHPFGYGRIEYLTSLVIGVLIIVTAVEVLINAVKLIFEPAEMSISVLSLVFVAVSAVVKFLLGTYTVKKGRETDSGALVAVGYDSRNDSFVSVVTILSAVVFLVFHVSLDAYVGIFTAVLILKTGIEVLKETVSELIGRPGEKELAKTLYEEIRKTDCVLAAADMMLHNYGPDNWSGSVNVECDHEKTVGEIYQELHELQLRIMHEHNVTMVFGVYAVDNDHEEVKRVRRSVAAFMKGRNYIKSFHAVYLEPDTGRIYVDYVVDYSLKDWESLREQFTAFMAEQYPDNEIILTIETEFV